MGRRLAPFVVVGAIACALGGDASGRSAPGGKMGNVSVKRLGDVVPGVRTGGSEPELVDPAPIVLWAGSDPAAVLVYRQRVEGGSLVEEIAPLPGSVGAPLRGAGAFPIVNRTRIATDPDAPAPDTIHPRGILTADVDGDGVDEIVVPRRHGSVELVAWKGVVARLPGPSGKSAVATYETSGAQVARLGGKAVAHLLLRRVVHDRSGGAAELSRAGAGDAYALVRADSRGLARVVLADLAGAHDVVAVGAINRPGSAAVDELFAVFRKGEGEEVWLSRHRPDGAAVGAPRRLYVPFDVGIPWQAVFVPQSRVAVLQSAASPSIYFVEPEAPVNWVHAVDLGAVASDPGRVQHLGVADAAARPKAVFRVDDAVYAVDAEGTYYTASGGAFVPSKKPAPFHRIAGPGPGYGGPLVAPSSAAGDEYLVVHGRAGGLKALGHDELASAADRYLDPEEVAAERRAAEPSLDDRDLVRDELVRAERQRRGVKDPVRTIEEWKRRLPDSYAAVAKDRQSRLDATLRSRLTSPPAKPSLLKPKRYRDLDALRAWLASMSGAAEVAFDVVRRGAAVQSFRVDAGLGRPTSDLARPGIDWRAGPAGTVLVTTLTVAEGDAEPAPGVVLVRAAAGGR